MKKPKVTIVIPVYNGMPHIKQAIESVQAQTYQDWKLIVVDDQSSDNTAEYLRTLDDPKIQVEFNEVNLKLEGNWNKALELAKGSTFFKLLCADDYLYANCLATEVAALEANPNVVMTASRRCIVDDNGETLIKARGLSGMSGVVDGLSAVRRSVLNGTNIIGEPTSVMLRSSVIELAGKFDATHKLLTDFDYWARVLRHGDLYAISEPLSVFRVGVLSDSLKTVKEHKTMHIGEFKMLANDSTYKISKPVLASGVVMSVAISEGRAMFYRALGWRDKMRARKSN